MGNLQNLDQEVQETCQLETMQGRCHWRSELIVMTSARWGRMETGRCLEIHPNLLAKNGQDPLFLGCSEDVLHIMDQQCSGRMSCDVRIADELDDIEPCYPDLTRYLRYTYICVKGNESQQFDSLRSVCYFIAAANKLIIIMMMIIIIIFMYLFISLF